MRRRARTDSNHHGVIEALRAAGWTVHDTSRLGDGFCDLVAARHGRIELIEVKDGSKPLSRQQATPAEQRLSLLLPLHSLLAGHICVTLRADDAARFLSGLRRRGTWADAEAVAVYGPAPEPIQIGRAHV